MSYLKDAGIIIGMAVYFVLCLAAAAATLALPAALIYYLVTH